MTGLSVADLFAGSGALGAEALSRGAKRLLAVDNRPEALRAIRANLASLEAEERAEVVKQDIEKGLAFLKRWAPLDLILADPPYGRGLVERLLGQMPLEVLSPGGRLVVESSLKEQPEAAPPWSLVKQRRYGDTVITILTPEAS